MKKPIIQASFLSNAIPSVSTIKTAENHLYILREKKEALVENASRLYDLFFGKPQSVSITTNETKESTEPDYYSSYE